MNHVVGMEVFEATGDARYLVGGKNVSHLMQEGRLRDRAGLPLDDP